MPFVVLTFRDKGLETTCVRTLCHAKQRACVNIQQTAQEKDYLLMEIVHHHFCLFGIFQTFIFNLFDYRFDSLVISLLTSRLMHVHVSRD